MKKSSPTTTLLLCVCFLLNEQTPGFSQSVDWADNLNIGAMVQPVPQLLMIRGV
jgi:hypothetical protein